MRKTLPEFYQHNAINTKTINHDYSPFRNSYRALPRSPSILLLSSYRQKLKQEVPVLRSIQRWSDQSEIMLQYYFDHTDWDMFWVA
jgi:hypothetical protein